MLPPAVPTLVITGTGLRMVTVPPVPAMLNRVASVHTPMTLVMGMESELLLVPEAMVAVTTATVPAAIWFAFIPLATQVNEPAPVLQLKLLLAPVSAGPAAIVRLVTSLG